MDTIFGIKQIQKKLTCPVVTLGVFDGVHSGHQKVIQETIDLANKKNGESIILTFDRHPKSVLSQTQQSCITSLEHRLVLFEQLGMQMGERPTIAAETVAAAVERDYISSGCVKVGEQLPRVRDFAQIYSVSPATVSSALPEASN